MRQLALLCLPLNDIPSLVKSTSEIYTLLRGES